jgi:hypothetical protein
MLKYLLGILVLLNILDAVLTDYLFRAGIATEGNPLLLPLVGQPAFLLVKLLGVIFAALVLWDIGRRHPTLALWVSACFVAIYTGIVAWNFSLLW